MKVTDSELNILQVLWAKGPCSVRVVHETINPQDEVGYTTTLKLLQIMFEKGLVIRDESQRSHIYDPVVTENDIQRSYLDKLIETAFKGSATNMVLQTLISHQPSAAELAEIKALLDKLNNQKPDR